MFSTSSGDASLTMFSSMSATVTVYFCFMFNQILSENGFSQKKSDFFQFFPDFVPPRPIFRRFCRPGTEKSRFAHHFFTQRPCNRHPIML